MTAPRMGPGLWTARAMRGSIRPQSLPPSYTTTRDTNWYSGVPPWLLGARKRLLVVLAIARMTLCGSSVGRGRDGVIRRPTANHTAPTEGMSGAIEAMSGRVAVA
jgi:hypothetical protein